MSLLELKRVGIGVLDLVPEWIKRLDVYPPGVPLEELEREYGITGSIKVASNENPLGPSPKAVRAIGKALAGLNRYPDGNATLLKEKLAKKLGVKPAMLVTGNGSNEILELLAATFLRPGDHAVISAHAFVGANWRHTGTVGPSPSLGTRTANSTTRRRAAH